MKPVKLIIEGINSFTEPQTLDFEAAGRSNLFCISGKTGAGKTTVFDSIMLALYGKSAKGNLADTVNLSLMSAKVTLEFIENGETYKVERIIKCRRERSESGEKTERRTAVSDCTLYKNGEPIAKGEAANDILTGIIGLDVSEFKNVYLLEQGEYAEFLKKSPAKQTEAVGKIFSLMRFGDVHKLAGEREKTELAKIADAETVVSGLGDVSPEKLRSEKEILRSMHAKATALLKEEEARVGELAELVKARDNYISVRAKQDNVKKLMIRGDETKKAWECAQSALSEFEKNVDRSAEKTLVQLRERLNGLMTLNALDRQYSEAVAEAAVKRKELEQKRTAAEKLKGAYAELTEKRAEDGKAFINAVGGVVAKVRSVPDRSATLENAERALGADGVSVNDIMEIRSELDKEMYDYDALCKNKSNAEKKIAELTSSADRLLDTVKKCNAELEAARAEKQAAENAARLAAEAYSAAQMCSHAAAVRAELHEGDVCPVCGGKYSGAAAELDADVEKRKTENVAAAEKLKIAQQREINAVKLSDRASVDYDNLDREKRSAENELIGISDKLRATKVEPVAYAEIFTALAAAKSAADRAASSNDMWLKRGPEISALEAELAAAENALAEIAERSDKYGAELGENRGKTDSLIAEVKAETARLEEEIKNTDEKLKKLNGDVQAAAASVAEAEKALEAARTDCPVDIPEFDEAAYDDKCGAAERIKRQRAENDKDAAVKEVEIKNLAEKCETLARIETEIKEHKKRAEIYKTISDLTYGKAMLNYVAAEYIAEFTSAASGILGELSSGKYSLHYDKINGFIVSDYLNGGKARKTDTLSGGELFLASLSVAIAIARTQSNGNNAFFFLDEGFGTLDEDLIDVVYGALESLSKDCLVGVITHAEALISRMPACVTVYEATDTSGSRIEI